MSSSLSFFIKVTRTCAEFKIKLTMVRKTKIAL